MQIILQIYVKSVDTCYGYSGFSEVVPKTKVSTIGNCTDVYKL